MTDWPKPWGSSAPALCFADRDLSMDTAQRKADLALFADNAALCDITENLVFSDPYFAAEMNHHTTPYLDDIVARLRRDIDLKVEVQQVLDLTRMIGRKETT